MVVAVLAVAWRVRFLVPVAALTAPAVERLTEFFENSLTGLCVEVFVAFVALEVGFERSVVGNLAASVPDPLSGPSANVPEFAGCEPERIEVAGHLRVVPNAYNMRPSDLEIAVRNYSSGSW